MDETRKILLELNIDTVRSIKNISDLKAVQKATNQELEKAKIGTEEYRKLEIASGLVTKRITGLKDATKLSTGELNVQKGSVRDLQAQYNILSKALRETVPGQDVLGKSFEEARQTALKLKTEIKDFNKSLGDDTGNVGNYGSAFKEAAGGINVFGTSLGALFKMITTNPVGIIVTALFALFNILKQNDEIATFFTGVMTGLGVVFDQISGAISELVLGLGKFGGENSKLISTVKELGTRILNQLLAPLTFLIDIMPAVSAALDRDFSKAADIATEASKNFGKSIVFMNDEVPKFVNNMSDAVKVGIAYEKSLDDIEAKQSKLNVTTSELINQRDRLKLQGEDLSRTDKEREALRERAIAIDKKILSQRVSLLNEEINTQKKYVDALGKDSTKREAAEFRLNDLLVKRLDFENESLKFQEKVQNKNNALIEKGIAEKEKSAEADKKRREEQAKDEDEFFKRSENSQIKLAQFKLDHASKTAKDADERLKAELRAEDFRVNVLLDNDKLLASEKEFILADSAARIEAIHQNSANSEIALAKKSADEKKNLLNKQVGDVANNANLLAGISQNLTQATLNNEESALENQRNKELKAAGNNAAKQDKINKDYDNRKAKIEREAAKRQANIQAAMALINTFTGVTKVIAEYPKFDFGIATAIGVGLTLASGLAQVANIKSQKFGLGGLFGGLKKFAFGGLQKSGIIGGKPHSEGGTKFVGSDGSMFEAEAGELMAIVNKRDTKTLSALSNINSTHGKPFFKDGGTYLADGGFAARSSSQSVIESASSNAELQRIISMMPTPIVTVEDINAGVQSRTKVVSGATV